MKIMKKTLALLLAVLTLLSVVSFSASAEKDYNYTISTAFYGYDSSADAWVPAQSVSAGDTVKMRVWISTNFTSGPATLLLAYDKSLLSASGLAATGSTQMTLNEDFVFTDKIQQISGANGANAANKQLGLGNITQEQFDLYSFLAFSIHTSGCVVYDGSDWIFELDMTVLSGCGGKSLECFVIPETVCTIENSQGFVSFPYAEEGATSLSELTSAYLWYEGTPVLESEKATVIPDSSTICEATFDANGGTWSDGAAEKTVSVAYSAEITAPESPEKQGYVFAGWTDGGADVLENLGTMDDVSGKKFVAVWIASTETHYTVETYTMNTSGRYGLSSEDCQGTTDEEVSVTPEIENGFELNSGKSVLSGVVASDGSLTLKVYIDRKSYKFTTVVDGVSTSTDYLYGASVATPATPSKQGYIFAGWDNTVPLTMPAENVTVTATWIASTETHYTVETYTMNTSGMYELSSVGRQGTTGEEVSVTPEIENGFELNGEKSVLSGVVAADGSLTLKVYIDRKSYKFTTVVDGVSNSADYLYGASVATPATPSKQGYAFAGWDKAVPSTMPAENVTVTAVFRIVSTVKIRNNLGSKTINYGETLRLTAETSNLPSGAYVKWFVEGSGVSMSQNSDGSTCEIKSTGSGTVTVTAKAVDKNGSVIRNESGSEISDSQKVTSNAGFWQKIVSFFKNLFGANRVIVQAFKLWQ